MTASPSTRFKLTERPLPSRGLGCPPKKIECLSDVCFSLWEPLRTRTEGKRWRLEGCGWWLTPETAVLLPLGFRQKLWALVQPQFGGEHQEEPGGPVSERWWLGWTEDPVKQGTTEDGSHPQGLRPQEAMSPLLAHFTSVISGSFFSSRPDRHGQ